MEKWVWVVIPAYNEERVIAQTLEKFAGTPYRIVVVDDGSTDQTAAEASQFNITVLRHMVNLGQGAALQTGITYALSFPQTKAIVTFDADGQHCVEEIASMLKPLDEGVQVVLGTRFAAGAKTIKMPFTRRIILKLAVIFTRFTTGLKITDTHNGFRAFSVEGAKGLKIRQNKMAHASEILSYIGKSKLKYREVPVTINYTSYSLKKGQSLFNSLNIFWEIISEKLR
ncbi:MAG TPA: glycosyltransferase family 2 protein [Anaerolineaceae bacterium]|nr:glycosyltransferase family 2 protein [Anaerolineaceae bacterium]HPN50903.1 glycosyltransferase family 2 protein [Anaerolineaceae bacterium]